MAKCAIAPPVNFDIMFAQRLLFALVTVLSCIAVNAQQKTKMGLPLINFLKGDHAADEQVNIFIHGPSDRVGEAVRAHGGTVKQALPMLMNARVPVNAIEALAQDPAVVSFEFHTDPIVELSDSARVKSRIDLIHAGASPLPQAYRGSGVIVGIIDTGIDPQHEDFRNEDGTTRILKYWDQSIPPGPLTPMPYGYGQAWSSSQINAGTYTSVDGSGHGTGVAGIAAGNGNASGQHAGMAPEADIIVVKSGMSPNGTSSVADAVQYIYEQAAALGRPAVVNISLGRRLGSHDALDAAALLIGASVEAAPGRALVCAAGNFDDWNPYHLRTEVDADTSFTWFKYNPNMNFGGGITGGVYFEAWGDQEDLQNVQFAIGADKVSPTSSFRGRTPFRNLAQNAGTAYQDTIFGPNGNRIGVVGWMAQARGGQYQVMVQLVQPDSNAYRFRLMSTGSGLFDVWSTDADGWSQMFPYFYPPPGITLPTPAEFPDIVNYVLPDNNMHITDSWTCSPQAITVANYRNETAYMSYAGTWEDLGGTEGDINITSSRGPTRDGRLKPEIAAPGDVVFGPYPLALLNIAMVNEPHKLASGGMHLRGGGTSASSPHVAGAVALYLEKCPLATYQEIREAFMNTAVADQLTGATPNTRWGSGKLDAFAALNTSNLDDFTIDVVGDVPFCSNGPITLEAPSVFADFDWSNGESGSNSIQFAEEGPISVIGYNASHCAARSDTLTFEVLQAPETPVISVDQFTLTSSEAFSYQWYFNGTPIDGADMQVYTATQNGNYSVMVGAPNGCSSMSDPVVVIITSIGEAAFAGSAIWPSPARDMLNVRIEANGGGLRIIDAQGKIVKEIADLTKGVLQIPIDDLKAGTYQVIAGGAAYRFVKLP